MKNNKGFLLAESLVVSTFVLTVLIFLFVQYQNLMTTYKNNTDYNNPEAIYNLGSASEYFSADNSRLVSLSNNLGSNAYIKVYDKNSGCNASLGLGTFCDSLFAATGAKKVIYTSSNLTTLKNYIKNNSDNYLNQSLRDFIKRLDADEIDGKGRLIAQFDNGYFATLAVNSGNTSETPIIPPDEPDEPTSTTACLIGDKQIETVSEGDGLYIDNLGVCFYKGTHPNNYIMFNNELWRIISFKPNDPIKIVRNDFIGNMYWDYESNFSVSNDWAKPSSLNTYLNGIYYKSLSSKAQSQIVSHNWGIGSVAFRNNNLTKQISAENSRNWRGKIGLIAASDYIRANSNQKCSTFQSHNDNNSVCKGTNWLFTTSKMMWWTISPFATKSDSVILINNQGSMGEVHVTLADGAGVRPTVYLNSNIRITGGNGTSSDPYILS